MPAPASSKPARYARRRLASTTPAAISDHPAASSATAASVEAPAKDPPGADLASRRDANPNAMPIVASGASPSRPPVTPGDRSPAWTAAMARRSPPTTASWHAGGQIPIGVNPCRGCENASRPRCAPGGGAATLEPSRKEAAMNGRHARGRAWFVLAAALATGAAACGSAGVNKAGSPAAPTTVLTLADGEGSAANALPFAEAVMQLSGGALQIKVKSHWRPDDPRYETGLIGDVQRGDAQLGVSASRAFDTVGISSFQALQAPFLIDNVALEQKVL